MPPDRRNRPSRATPPRWGSLSLAAILVVGTAGCGSDEGERPAAPGPGTTDASAVPTATVKVVARDMGLEPEPATAPAGTIAFEYVNEGQLQHTLVIAGQEKRLALGVAGNGDVDNGTVDLPPGAYVLYCDIPGHRTAGMEAKLTVQ